VRDIGETPTAEERSAQHTLLHAVRAVLRLFAPLMPYVTETTSQAFTLPGDNPEGIHARGNWPKTDDLPSADTNRDLGQAVVEIVAGMRKVKSNLGVSMRTEVTTLHVWPLEGDAKALATLVDPATRDLLETSTAHEIVFAAPADADVPTAEAPGGTLNVALVIAPSEDA